MEFSSEQPKRLTVALISSYQLHVGGVETHLLSVLRYSDTARYRFVLIGPISPELAAQAEGFGAKVVQWKTKRVTHLISLVRLWHILRAYDIDLIHFHCPRAAFMARVLTKLLKLPTAVTVHLPPYYFTGQGMINSPFGLWLYKRCERLLNNYFTDKLIYASFQVMEEARAMGLVRDENTVFIGNGVSLRGLYNQDKSFTWNISGTINRATDLGKAMTQDITAANSAKLAGASALLFTTYKGPVVGFSIFINMPS